jgi:hypothetical protein
MSEEKEVEERAANEFENNVVAIWSKAVDTQMHFNEMSVKSRHN